MSIYHLVSLFRWAAIAHSVERLATCWTVRGSSPGGTEIFRTCSWGPPNLLYSGYRVFPGSKVQPGRGERKCRAIPLLPLWIFVACSRASFTFACFDVEYIYGFVWSGSLQAKSMTSQRNRATHKMADMRYYGNVMTTTRWRLYVTMETLWQQQHYIRTVSCHVCGPRQLAHDLCVLHM